MYKKHRIVASTTKQVIEEFLATLGGTFQIWSYPLEHFLGITITKNREQRTIHLGKPDYIENLVNKFQMTSCFPKSAPADPETHLIKPAERSPTDTAFPYREAV